MRLIAALLLLLMGISTSAPLEAQQVQWIPQGITALQHSAASKTQFTFDHSMLVLASKLEGDNQDLRRVLAGVDGISFRNFHFAAPGQFNAEALNSLNAEYHTAGWERLVNNHDKSGEGGATDLWIRLQNNAVSNVAILVSRPNEVTFISISGSISPLDLSHLAGHFGIPKIEGGFVVPNTKNQP